MSDHLVRGLEAVVILLLILRSVVWSPLVWILLRLVVALLLIVLPGPATRLAVVPSVATLMIVRLAVVVLALNCVGASPLLRVVVRAALVVIPVHARLVLVVLLLILIPAGATGGAHVWALLEPTLIIVSSTI